MKMILHSVYKSILFLGLFVGCSSAPKILFKDPVDTETKSISYQEKKVFTFARSGVSFSNKFEGARLNAVDQLNDSVFIVTILPENEPGHWAGFGKIPGLISGASRGSSGGSLGGTWGVPRDTQPYSPTVFQCPPRLLRGRLTRQGPSKEGHPRKVIRGRSPKE